MFIVLVGPDCAGKSTIGRAIEKEFNIPLKHNERIGNQFSVLAKVVADLDAATKGDLLLDRWQYPDDIIYQRACQDTTSILSSVREELDDAFNRRHGIFIYVRADFTVLTERYNQRGDQDRSLEEILRAGIEYDWFFSQSKANRIVIDTTEKSQEEMCAEAIRRIKLYYEIELEEE